MTDTWSGLADLFAGLIEKYVSALDLDALPEPAPPPNALLGTENNHSASYPCEQSILHG